MSCRVDTSPLIAGACVVGDTGHGVLGSEVPSTGTHGAGYLYNDLSLPADASKEIRGQITTGPSGLTSFFAYEDSSFIATGPDGSYFFEYRLYVDGVASSTDIGYGPGIARCTFGIGTVAYDITADGATYALTGGAATLKVSRKLVAAGATYALSGGTATLKVSRKLAAAGASYTLTGGNAIPKSARKIVAAGATYALTGGTATFSYSGAGATYTLSAEAGTYTLTGADAALKVARKLTAAGATYATTYQDAALRRGYLLTAAAGSYALTGGTAALKVSRKLAAAGATYTLTGAAATLDWSGDTSVTIPTMPPYITVYMWKRTA